MPSSNIMKSLLNLLLLGAVLTSATKAAEAPDPSQKLLAQLRAVTLQLRSAQTEGTNAQAAQAAAEQKSTELAAKITELEKRNASLIEQSTSDKKAADKAAATLTTKLADRDKHLEETTAALEKWKAGYEEATGTARAKEEERAKLAAEALELKRTIADREGKNIALFNTAIEVLDRFEKYSLGKALAAREPFIGTTRVKVENLVQGYKDKILDNRISAKKSAPQP